MGIFTIFFTSVEVPTLVFAFLINPKTLIRVFCFLCFGEDEVLGFFMV